ncbi:MAG TPA: metal ABC transporter permease [Methanofastidiosum sp.]|jgi:ABC-type Mn2+/Zn2+ transport system permease subunit|nr:metal ABC transporter permease [Methanofastidiosum sp.]HOC77887.1 metal ABC transporter permease [Methanofastidiosum sp.]HOG73526.1 metal ABC transporter permease [Methanofastidiosum sp.]HPA49101.1 metal ABC transporter permease [Methanofastidiosum sp.]HQK62726.1 metal ABC transporter permease [Methanofastidiosum sp.]
MLELVFTKILLFAIIGAVLTGFTCSLMGTFVVRMNLSSLGFAMSHAAFAGAALGIFLRKDPLIFALLFSIFVSLALGPLADKAKLKTDVIIGVIFSLSMAIGLLFLNMSPDTAMSSTALRILWGSVLGMTTADIMYLLIISVITIIFVMLFFKEINSILFDRKLARASGINDKPFYYLILFLTSVTVAFSLKLVGGLLVFALMINPTSSVYQFTYDMKKIILLSPIVGVISCLLGILMSFSFDLPTGSAIAIVCSAIFGVSVLVSPKRRKG